MITIIIILLSVQYFLICFGLAMDEYRTRKEVLIHLIPFYFYKGFVIAIIKGIKNLE